MNVMKPICVTHRYGGISPMIHVGYITLLGREFGFACNTRNLPKTYERMKPHPFNGKPSSRTSGSAASDYRTWVQGRVGSAKSFS